MRSVMGANGKKCVAVGGSCSCCGAQQHMDGEYPWYVYRAGWCDSDGVFYSRLCGDANGIGCISEVMPDTKSEKAQLAEILIEMMPNEIDDGIVTELEDYSAFE